ncbi:MAG: hypothetical protein Q9217_004417 [Psora testacea]
MGSRLWLAIYISVTLSGAVIGQALESMSAPEIEDALQQCGFVQELNHHRRATAPPTSGLTAQIFEVLFPYGPATNALLATLYISGPPTKDFLLALCPPNIDPSSLSVMVAFAVGGLLGDTIFHLLPEIFLGETSPDHARFVLVDPNRNLLLGVAILVGFLTFVAMDKTLRIATGGEGGYDHDHSVMNEEEKKDDSTSAMTSSAQRAVEANGSIRSRKNPLGGLQISSDAHALKLPNDSIRKLWNVPEPARANRWLSAVLEEDDDEGVTQIAIWKAYESAFKHNRDIPMLEATLLIHNAGKVFENASAHVIEGQVKMFIIKGVRPKTAPKQEEVNTSTELVTSLKPDFSANKPSQSIRLSAYLNLIADFTHNITDGLALSSSFYASPTLGATTTVAVFFHEIPHEVGDFALLIQSGFPKRRAMGAQFVTALGALLGTFLGIAVQELGKTEAGEMTNGLMPKGLFGTGLGWGDMLLPFTAGTFLYVGTVAVIPELLETGPNKGEEVRKTLTQFLAMFVGAGIMLG